MVCCSIDTGVWLIVFLYSPLQTPVVPVPSLLKTDQTYEKGTVFKIRVLDTSFFVSYTSCCSTRTERVVTCRYCGESSIARIATKRACGNLYITDKITLIKSL
jgi:predicted RNA-binding Zn-ribbon protein involved in translation (DUF1610 family)